MKKLIDQVINSLLVWMAVTWCSAGLAIANNPGGYQTTVTTNVTTGTESFYSASTNTTVTDVFVDNGIIHADLGQTSGAVDSLLFLKPGNPGTPLANGIQMVSQTNASTSNFGGHCHIYYSWTGSPSTNTGLTMTYTQNSSSIVDICYKRAYQSGDPTAFDQEYHWVLMKGNTGLYTYAVFSHPDTYPAATVGEVNVMCPCAHDANNFTCEDVFVDDTILTDLKIGGVQQPRAGLTESFYDTEHTVSVPGSPAEVQQLTTGTFAGDLNCKYTYNIDYGGTYCWGRASDLNHVGEWWVMGSQEYINAGPTMNEYPQGWGLLYYSFQSGHYLNPAITVTSTTSNWKKMWGPFLFYCNSQTTGTDAWNDAEAQSAAERSAWPYSWVSGQSAWQTAAQRATVTGKLVIADNLRTGASAAGAWVGLAAPDSRLENDDGNWQYQAYDYQYWVQCDSSGNFTIPNVRVINTDGHTPTFALYAFSQGTSRGTVSGGKSSGNGCVGEFESAPFNLYGSTNLGTITWHVPHHGSSVVWEVGIPDRKALDYKHSDEYINPALLPDTSTEFTNPLEIDTTSTDWEDHLDYVHTCYNTGSGYVNWPWDFNFTLAAAPTTGNYWLNIAFAGGQGTMQVKVNGTTLGSFNVPHNNDAFVRQACHSKYALAHFAIPSTMLHSGANTVTLIEASVGAELYEMYDYIDLETPPPQETGTYEMATGGGTTIALGMGASSLGTLVTYNSSDTTQKWNLVNIGNDSSGRQVVEWYNASNNQPLVANSSNQAQTVADGTGNQVWQVIPITGGLAFRNAGDGYKALDGGTPPTVGNTVNINSVTYLNGQIWTLH